MTVFWFVVLAVWGFSALATLALFALDERSQRRQAEGPQIGGRHSAGTPPSTATATAKAASRHAHVPSVT